MTASVVVIFAAALYMAEAPTADWDRKAVAVDFAAREERFWRRIAVQEPYDTMGSRAVFAYALALAESRQHPERLTRLFDLGARMQDRNPESDAYGNLWWSWRHGEVTDRNAVEFCGQDALTIWMRHREWLPAGARQQLHEILTYAIDGLMRHRVPTEYTNIAILNAGNLIVIGEAMGRPDVAIEGYRRLEGICLWTWQFGTHEYVSPTYYAPDLFGLAFIREFAGEPRGREQAKALFDLLWTDVALNWFAPAARLAGPHSRSYDYVRGLGGVDGHLILEGWIPHTPTDAGEFFHSAMFRFDLPRGVRQLNQRYPRIVLQSWGTSPVQSRTHAVYPDVTLGTAASIYAPARQDMPLTVDLPGDRLAPRCYFIPDGREDAYGRRRFATGAAGHAKALHLTPFWAAAQRNRDALGLVVYRPEDLAGPEIFNVQSHFVVRRPPDGIWLSGRRIEVPLGVPDEAGRVPVGVGEALVLRYGSAAVGVRVAWARRQDGEPSSVSLVDDGNRFDALRLSIEHRSEQKTIEPAAVIWVRIGSGLDDATFDAWRRAFDEVTANVDADADRIACSIAAEGGPVSVAARRPFGPADRVQLTPKPYRGSLGVQYLTPDGSSAEAPNVVELGRPILAAVEPMRSHEGPDVDRPLQVPAEGVQWPGEAALMLPGMLVVDDPTAQAGSFVWQPNQKEVNRPLGSLLVPVELAKAGRYYLWARVQAPTPESDSLFVRIIGEQIDLPRTEWHIRLAQQWTWQPVSLERPGTPTAFDLPAGRTLLQLQTRESGVKLDTFLLTPELKPRLLNQ